MTAPIRIFKVTRIQTPEVTADSFDRPADFSVERHFRDSFGITQSDGDPVEVVARFRGPVAGLVEERLWHESQRLQWLRAEETLFDEALNEPETLIATFRLVNMIEFKRWIKGFGHQAEVLKPEWLRYEMRAELQAAARQYGD